MKFSDKLAKLRKANNLSQEQLAEMLGVTRQSVSKWESGESYPDMAKIIQICKILNCKLNDIMEDGLIEDSDSTKKENAFDKDVDIVKKYLDSFLSFVTKTYNMFMHMTFKEKLKLIFEMLFIGLLLSGLVRLIESGIESFLFNLLSVIANTAIINYVRLVLSSVTTAALVILAFIVFFHLFKIRYLDYYVTLTDSNISKQVEEKPIDENKPAFNNNEPKVIIRDPKHSSSLLLNGLGKVFMLIFKAILIMIAIPVVLAVLMGVGTLFFFIFSKSTLLASSSLILIGAILFGFILLLVIFNILFNHKQQYKTLLLLFIVSILTCGIGFGTFSNKINTIDRVHDYDYEEKSTEIVTIDELKENDRIHIESDNIKFVVDENKKDLEIEFIYPKSIELIKNVVKTEVGTEYFFSLNMDDFSTLQQIFVDLNSSKIRDSYASVHYLHAKITCNSKNKEMFAYLAD